MNFNYRNTTQLYFTKEISHDINNFIVSNNFKKILIITGGTSTEQYAKIISNSISVENTIISGVVSNPLSETVEKMATIAKDYNPDLILTVGGGSVHDTGKAVAVMFYDSENTIEDYTVTGKLSVPGIKKVLPVITVPTILGSGAEVSPASLLRIGNEKRVIFSPLLHPLASFINIDWSKSLNKSKLARSAFDSFIQALEGFISTSANNISDAFAVTSIEYYNDCLPALLDGCYTDDVIEKLAIASVFSSYVCSTASVGAIHAISDPISGRFDVHHGTALAMVATDVLKKNLSSICQDRIQKIDLMLFNLKSEKTDIRERVIEKVASIIEKQNLLQTITTKSITHQTLLCMVKESFNGDMVGNPYEFSENEILDILGKWYET